MNHDEFNQVFRVEVTLNQSVELIYFIFVNSTADMPFGEEVRVVFHERLVHTIDAICVDDDEWSGIFSLFIEGIMAYMGEEEAERSLHGKLRSTDRVIRDCARSLQVVGTGVFDFNPYVKNYRVQ